MQLQMKSKTFSLKTRTHIMGILNVTPDSFSDGGKYNEVDQAIRQALKMEAEGADFIDVGGESTRPDHEPISAEEEMERVIPIIEALKKELSIPISIDTYKSETAEAAIQAGAEMINDVWGAKFDSNIATVAKMYNVPIVLMHNRRDKAYQSIIADMISDLEESVSIVKQAGINETQIILDPGIGFGKHVKDNFIVMNHLEQLTEHFPYPFLLGTSRKSFINEVLDLPAQDRDNATGASTCLGIVKGVHIIRVHDVKRHVELAKMMDAMLKGSIEYG